MQPLLLLKCDIDPPHVLGDPLPPRLAPRPSAPFDRPRKQARALQRRARSVCGRESRAISRSLYACTACLAPAARHIRAAPLTASRPGERPAVHHISVMYARGGRGHACTTAKHAILSCGRMTNLWPSITPGRAEEGPGKTSGQACQIRQIRGQASPEQGPSNRAAAERHGVPGRGAGGRRGGEDSRAMGKRQTLKSNVSHITPTQVRHVLGQSGT
jgi:hypothetical protein